MLIRSFVLLLTIAVLYCYGNSANDDDELPFIRHGRSRVRHSTELRWGLKALDNLTLDYEDGFNGTEPNGTLYGDSNSSFVDTTDVSSVEPVTRWVTGKKKVRKKEIMESIKKNVDKGLEYLRTHADAVEATMSMIDMRMKRGPDTTLLAEVTSTTKTTTTKKPPPPPPPPDIKALIMQQQQKILQEKKQKTNNESNTPMADDATINSHKSSQEDYSDQLNDEEFIIADVDLIDAEGGTSSVFQMDEIDLEDLDEVSRENRKGLMKGQDVVTTFLRIVESQHLLGANCTAGTALNLGEGVVDRYAQDRFRIEAEIAVNRANMLTRVFKITAPAVQESEHLLHASVLSMVDFDDDIFAAGHCFDWNKHPVHKGLFCPFAFRLPAPEQGVSLAKNLAAEYHYLGNTSEWFFLARKNAERVIEKNEQYTKAYHLYSNSSEREVDQILTVKYEDGRWSKPYYDCGGGNIWMLTYTVPFFGYENGTYHFKGTSGIDIDLRRVDIDQCPQKILPPGTTMPLNIFAGTDKCKPRTTECTAVPGLGFRRGSYRCFCKRGFYFPDTSIEQKYYNGSTLEEEYEKLMVGELSLYSDESSYECLPCAEGCDYCEDSSPCVAELNWPMRTSILILACAVIGFLPPAAVFTFRYQQVKVVRAASPALLRVIALGAFFIYCTSIVMYPPPSIYTCTARVWLREIGFSLTYGALMLKTWRISVIFRIRSAKTIIITDASLLKRLGMMCGFVGLALLVRTLVSPPVVIVGRTADNLKAFLCKTDWWDHTFTSMEVLFLAWGVRLCIMVRKAPSEFNESRFISMAIYNEFLLTCFLNVSMLFLQSPANPDLLYIIFFCHTQLTVTLLLALIFGSKVYMVFRGSGKAHEDTMTGMKASGAKFMHRSQIKNYGNSSMTTSTAQAMGTEKLTDQEALEEIKALQNEIQRLLERSPHNGAAIGTISSLLEAFRQPRSSQLMLKPPPPPNQSNNKANGAVMTPTKVDKSINTDTIDWKEVTGTRITIMDEGTIQQQQQQEEEVAAADDDESRYTSNSNVNFDDLDLKCMCSEDEEDCGNYTEKGCTAEQHPCLRKQCSDMHLESRLRTGTTLNDTNSRKSSKKTYESCDNLYSCNTSSRPKDTKSIDSYQLGFNPYSKHYAMKKQPEKLDSAEITRKLLQVTAIQYESRDDEPPPVPPRRSNGKIPTSHVIEPRSDGDEDNSNATSVAGSEATTEPVEAEESNGNSTGIPNRRKSPEKRLVLDLNDKSKYTEEVSV